MTKGFFRNGEAFVEIDLNGAAAAGKAFDCVIDTGFPVRESVTLTPMS